MTLGVFLGGLALVWALGRPGGARGGRAPERTFTFPLNSSARQVTVRSAWRRGHLTPQDDQVELTLEGACATAHLYAYLSTGWDDGPLDAATVILGVPLRSSAGPPRAVIRHNATSAIVLAPSRGRGVLVIQDAARNYDTLLVDWQGKGGCSSSQRGRAARELGRLFQTFKVKAPAGPRRAGAGLATL